MCMTFSYCCIVSALNSIMLKYFYLNITLDYPTPFLFHCSPFLCSNPALLMTLPPFSNTDSTTNSWTQQRMCYHWKQRCPSLPTHQAHSFQSLYIIRKVRLVLAGLVLPWIRAWSISSHHHLMLGCTGERKREGLNSRVQKREGAKGTFPFQQQQWFM